MTKGQEDTMNMYESTSTVLHNNSTVWSANVPFTAAVGVVDANISTISNLRDQQELDNTGVSDDKDTLRHAVENQTFTILSILIAYAHVVGNGTLLKAVRYSRSHITHVKDNELPGIADIVHTNGAANQVAAASYGLTTLMLSNQQTAITNFIASIGKPRAAAVINSAATQQMPKVFTDTNDVLEHRIDTLTELFHTSNLAFYDAYFNARKIVSSPTGTRALTAKFVDSVTGAAIEFVSANIDSGAARRRSSSFGNIIVQNLVEGAHSMVASIPGYVSQTIPFNVVSGATTKLTVQMVKS